MHLSTFDWKMYFSLFIIHICLSALINVKIKRVIMLPNCLTNDSLLRPFHVWEASPKQDSRPSVVLHAIRISSREILVSHRKSMRSLKHQLATWAKGTHKGDVSQGDSQRRREPRRHQPRLINKRIAPAACFNTNVKVVFMFYRFIVSKLYWLYRSS